MPLDRPPGRGVGGFDDVQVLLNAPRHTVEEAIGALFTDRVKDDLLLLYFSGHGVLDAGGQLFLAVSSTKHHQLLGTAVQAVFIKHAMDASWSRRQVLILD